MSFQLLMLWLILIFVNANMGAMMDDVCEKVISFFAQTWVASFFRDLVSSNYIQMEPLRNLALTEQRLDRCNLSWSNQVGDGFKDSM